MSNVQTGCMSACEGFEEMEDRIEQLEAQLAAANARAERLAAVVPLLDRMEAYIDRMGEWDGERRDIALTSALYEWRGILQPGDLGGAETSAPSEADHGCTEVPSV